MIETCFKRMPKPKVMIARYYCGVGLIAVTASFAVAQSFTDVTGQSGVDYLHYDPSSVESGIHNLPMTGGAAVGDADGDGWPDVYVTRIDQPDILS
jgi:hypothetical protein